MRERLGADDRGVSEVVGAILMFGLLVLLLSIVQTQAVPAQNQEIEIRHSQEIQDDLTKWHEIAADVSARGTPRSASVSTGTDYPPRLLFINPPPVQGSLATSSQSTASIANIESADPAVNDYIVDDQGNTLDLDTRTLEYRGNYNEYQNGPRIRYEYGLLYSQFENDAVVANAGNIIDGTNINLIFLNGSYSRTSGGDQSISVQPVSAPARSVTIEHSGTGDMFIDLPSELDESTWEAEYNTTDSVDEITKPDPDTVRIDLNESKQYNLRMSQIGLERNTGSPKGYYIVPAGDGTTSVSESSTTNVQYEVRDEYNNPVSNVSVDINAPGGTIERTTDDRGRVTAPVTPASPGTQQVGAEIDSSDPDVASGCPGPDRCTADYTVQVTDLSINPGSGVRLTDSSIKPSTINSPGPVAVNVTTGNSNVIEVTFNVTGSNDREIDSIRMNLYSASEDGPVSAGMNNSDDSIVIEDMDIGGQFYDSSSPEWKGSPDTLQSGSLTTYEFLFYDSSGNGRVAEDTDYFVLTIEYQNGERAIYFVSPD
jgi:hypothetical protein